MFKLDGKIAIVTGAGSGIGAAIAMALASAGARVWVADRDEAGGNATVANISRAGNQAHFLSLDVTDESACRAAVEAVTKDAGRIDVLVNNAGVGMVGNILQTSGEELDRLWSVNLKGMFFLCKAVLPGMVAAKRGSIINLGSVAAVTGMFDRFAYTTTKHAVAGLTRSLALDFGESGVRVNAICPGRVDTPFVQARLKEYPEPEKYLAQMVAPHALKRMAKPDEIAAAALYLASDESSFVTGSMFSIDGGYTTGK